MAVIDYIDGSVLSPVFGNDIPLIRSERINAICEELTYAIKNKESIFVYGDYDMDGFCCDMVWGELLKQAGVSSVSYFKYGSRTHAIDKSILYQVGLSGARVVIICDTGSSLDDRRTIDLLKSAGYTPIVIDHHVYFGDYLGDTDGSLMFNAYEERDCLSDSPVSGAYACLLVGKVLCEKYLQIAVPHNAKVFALASMYSDVVDMSSVLGRALYNSVAISNAKGPVFFQEMNQYSYLIGQRFFTYIVAPKINGCFRSERWDLLNGVLGESDRFKLRTLCRDFIEVHNEVRKLTKSLVPMFKRERIGDIVLCIHEVTEETAMLHIRNYTGVIANRIAEEEKSAVVVLVRENRFYEGSYRDYYNRELLSRFSLFCEAGGHPSAFGMQVIDFYYFMRNLKALAGQMEMEFDRPYISLSSSSVSGDADISALALYNEYMNVKPKVLVMHRCNNTRLVNSTTYYKYFSVGMPCSKLLVTSRTLHDDDDILVEPMICRGVELRERE